MIEGGLPKRHSKSALAHKDTLEPLFCFCRLASARGAEVDRGEVEERWVERGSLEREERGSLGMEGRAMARLFRLNMSERM